MINMLEYFMSYAGIKLDKRGVTALEYAILAGIISVALIAAFAGWGDSLKTKLGTALTAAPAATK